MGLNIAIVAHDARKKEMFEWVKNNIDKLKNHYLFATGTTGKLLANMITETKLCETNKLLIQQVKPLKDKVTCLLSGPLGGDSQISAMIAEGKIDVLIFFCDNLITQGHQQDVGALSRLASLYNIAFATNKTTADFILNSKLFNNKTYKREIPKIIENYKNRYNNYSNLI